MRRFDYVFDVKLSVLLIEKVPVFQQEHSGVRVVSVFYDPVGSSEVDAEGNPIRPPGYVAIVEHD